MTRSSRTYRSLDVLQPYWRPLPVIGIALYFYMIEIVFEGINLLQLAHRKGPLRAGRSLIPQEDAGTNFC